MTRPRFDTALVQHVADTLHRAQEAGELPQVSSPVSAMIGTLGGDANAPARDYVRALEIVAGAYAAVLRGARLQSVSRVLSLCTGYDAAMEFLALQAVYGRLAAYVSIERDAAAARLNAACCRSVSDVGVRSVCADFTTPEGRGLIEAEAFELCVVFRPPIFRTRCGDVRRLGGGGLFPTPPDASVAQALVSVVEWSPSMALLVVTRDAIELEAFGRVCGKTLGRMPTAVVHDADSRLPLHAGILGKIDEGSCL